MTIGASIFLAAVGAVLRYAVADSFEDVDLRMIGLILMVAGAVGLVVGVFLEASRRRTVVVDRTTGQTVDRTRY